MVMVMCIGLRGSTKAHLGVSICTHDIPSHLALYCHLILPSGSIFNLVIFIWGILTIHNILAAISIPAVQPSAILSQHITTWSSGSISVPSDLI